MKVLVAATLVLFAATVHAEGDVPAARSDTAQPSPTGQIPEGSFLLDKGPLFKKVPLPQPAPPQRMSQAIKDFDKEFPPIRLTPKQQQELEREFQTYDARKKQDGPFTPFKCEGGKCPLEVEAKECGTRLQNACSPSNLKGRTMCGMAVGMMIECMKHTIKGASPECTGRCGHGKMFVSCDNGQMAKCGYQKLGVNDNKCKMPGAVLAYTHSLTPRGMAYGHVEFVCGQGQYCSVYSQPHKGPWPYPVPDACWYPQQQGPT